MRRHNLQHVDLIFLLVLGQLAAVGRDFIGHQVQRAPRDQRRINAGVAQIGADG